MTISALHRHAQKLTCTLKRGFLTNPHSRFLWTCDEIALLIKDPDSLNRVRPFRRPIALGVATPGSISYPLRPMMNSCTHQLFEAQVEGSPSAIAIRAREGCWTYRELNRRSNQVANYLRTLGVRPGCLVGLCLPRSLDLVAGMLGVLKAGGAYVPLDPVYPRPAFFHAGRLAGVGPRNF